jgi:hypothetical protein
MTVANKSGLIFHCTSFHLAVLQTKSMCSSLPALDRTPYPGMTNTQIARIFGKVSLISLIPPTCPANSLREQQHQKEKENTLMNSRAHAPRIRLRRHSHRFSPLTPLPQRWEPFPQGYDCEKDFEDSQRRSRQVATVCLRLLE